MRQSKRGLSLVEVLVALALLAGLGLAIATAILQVRKTTEDNLRQTAAITVAAGHLEQSLGLSFQALRDILANPAQPLRLQLDPDRVDELYLNRWVTIEIPLVSEVDEATGTLRVAVAMPLELRLELTDLRPEGVEAVALAIRYAWNKPSTHERLERVVKTIRANVR